LKNPAANVLVIGYGNPARGDDGLGPEFAQKVATLGIAGVTVDSDYQLTPEDAHAVASSDIVIFADADISGSEPFTFRKLEPESSSGIGSHGVEPGEVIALSEILFHARPQAYVLGIRGYDFTMFKEGLTSSAINNLDKAISFFKHVASTGTYGQVALPPRAQKCQSKTSAILENAVLN